MTHCSRCIRYSVLSALIGAALAATATYLLVRGPSAMQATATLQRPSTFLANLYPAQIIEKGSADQARWEWTEVTGPEPTRCATCMRNFIGHVKLGQVKAQKNFIVNDFQHRIWEAIETAGGRILQSNDGRYLNGQSRTDTARGDSNLTREYQYVCYRIGDSFGIAHMIGLRVGEDLTVVLIVHEQGQGQPFPDAMPAEEKDVRAPQLGDERPGRLHTNETVEGWPVESETKKQAVQKK